MSNVILTKGYNLNWPTLLYFYSPSCPHCISFSPTFDQATSIYKDKNINIIKIDASNTKRVKYLMPLGVNAFPTVRMYHNGSVFPFSGPRTVANLQGFINPYLTHPMVDGNGNTVYNQAQVLSPLGSAAQDIAIL